MEQQQEASLYNVLTHNFGEQLQPQLQRKATLTMLSHAIEDEVLGNNLSPVIFAAFQDIRYYQPERPRYDLLRTKARAVALFGRSLSEAQALDQDWFVVINEPRFKVVLASQEVSVSPELDHFKSAQVSDSFRPFQGIWSYDREVVDFASRYLATQAGGAVAQSVEEVVAMPHQPFEQVRYVSNISDRILLQMEATNRHALGQISRNQQLLNDLEQQAGLLQDVEGARQLAEHERSKLHRELNLLYNDITRSQTMITQAIVDKARLEQAVEGSKALLESLRQQLKTLSQSEPTSVLKIIDQLQGLLTPPQPNL